MKAKTTARVKSAEEIDQETEFYRRLSLPAVDVRRITSTNAYDIVLHHHQLGVIGSKTEILRRGKVVQVLYVLPRVEPKQFGDTLVSIG